MGAKERYILLLIIDSLIVTFSVFVGYYILAPFFLQYTLPVLIMTSIILLISHHVFAYIFNLYHRAWEYASVRELISIAQAVTASIIATYILNMFLFQTTFTRLMIITWMMHLILIGGSRLSWRMIRHRIIGKDILNKDLTRTLVIGAGKGGSLLIRQMMDTPSMNMIPVVAVDDDIAKQRVELAGGIRVEGTRDDIERLIKKYGIKKVVIAIPSLSKTELNKIYEVANYSGIEVMIMPNIDDVMSGKIEVNTLKKVEVEDLLGREPVELDVEGIEEQVTDRTVLVTGAGGSIGSEIVRQVSKFKPRRILLLGHGENSIYSILEEMSLLDNNIEYIPLIADIQDRKRIFQLFQTYKPHIVYHAAAHKHVPLMEYNPEEAVKNNVIGTKNTAEAACGNQTEKFVLISTDKAVNPPNIMGATKRLAEMTIQALNEEYPNTTLVAVRFGNVLGSRGSVIPKFKQQIEKGGPVTVTDARMTRYFMTIPEASRLVIQAGVLAKGGEVFVLDMGEPVRILDLAHNMIKLSGFKEDEISIRFSGIRPGEKLYEELLNDSEISTEKEGLDDEWLYNQFMLYSLHGQSKDAFSKSQKGAWEYDIIYPGFKCNMTDISASIGLIQLERYDYLLNKRRNLIEIYDEHFKNTGVETIQHYTHSVVSTGHLYLTRISGIDEQKRNEIIVKMAEKGVSCNVHYKPLPMLTAYQNLGFSIQDYPNAYKQYTNEITLPLHTLLSKEDLHYVIECYKEIINATLSINREG